MMTWLSSTQQPSMLCRFVARRLLFTLTQASAIQYPYEQDEDGRYYSGYDNSVHEGVSYDGYSIWVGPACMLQSVANSYQDVYRAQWAWLILMAPERVPGMITSMLNDYREVSLAKEPAAFS